MRIGMESYLAEFVGTFFFILSILASAGNAYIVGIALAIVILLIGAVSGGNVNPAVSLAMYMKGTLSHIEFVYYVVAQVLGSAGAVYAFKMIQH
jgi:aquaporin Z